MVPYSILHDETTESIFIGRQVKCPNLTWVHSSRDSEFKPDLLKCIKLQKVYMLTSLIFRNLDRRQIRGGNNSLSGFVSA